MSYISNSPTKTKQIAGKVAERLQGGEVLCLYGDLGAGKTVFTTAVINYFLPVKRVLSPTFIIVRRYQVVDYKIKNILHVDLYRIENVKEIKNLEFLELIHKPDYVVIVEWADRLKEYLPRKRIDIFFNIKNKSTRLIRVRYVQHK